MAVGSLSQNGSACVALGRERPGGAAWVSGARQSARPLGALRAAAHVGLTRAPAPPAAGRSRRQEIVRRSNTEHASCTGAVCFVDRNTQNTPHVREPVFPSTARSTARALPDLPIYLNYFSTCSTSSQFFICRPRSLSKTPLCPTTTTRSSGSALSHSANGLMRSVTSTGLM